MSLSDGLVPTAPTRPATNQILDRRSPRRVTAPLNFVVYRGQRPQVHIVPPGEGVPARSESYQQVAVEIDNGRDFVPQADLEREGFELVNSPTAVQNFLDVEEVERVYYPEIERLVKAVTGASKVVAFDHNLRRDAGDGVNDEGLRKPVRIVHNDYTEKSGPQRVRDLLEPEEAERLRHHRFAVVNVWRPIRGPVETAPLAVGNAQTIASGDLIATDLIYSDRVGEIYEVNHNPAQHWVYFPKMVRDEALLIKGYDSEGDGRARFTPHTAFDDPNTPPDAAPRESIEARTLVFFAPEPGAEH